MKVDVYDDKTGRHAAVDLADVDRALRRLGLWVAEGPDAIAGIWRT